MERLADGAYVISDRFVIPGEGESNFVFCAGWLLEIIEIEAGEFYFLSDGLEIHPAERRFGIFYPPFTIVRSYVKDLHGRVCGVGATDKLPGLPPHPIIFDTEFDGPFTGAAQAVEIIEGARNIQSIEIVTKPSLLSVKTKKLIDENYSVHPSIGRTATRIGVSHEHLSRQFKRDYGMTPSAYLRELRIADATFRLYAGDKIVDISGEVGYNDLSRFYKQFRQTKATAPGECRTILKSKKQSI